MHQTLTTTLVRIKSSDNNMHVGKSLDYLCIQNKQAFCIGPWHQDVLAKRTLWEFWMVNVRKSHKAESDHWIRRSLIIKAMQGVVIAIKRMHIELCV